MQVRVSNARQPSLNNMFELNRAISDWRHELASGGLKYPGVLDELESHLRDDIERRTRGGASSDGAFHRAVEQIGGIKNLKTEFEKVQNKERNYMKRSLIISLGILGVFVGMAFVMPAVAQYQHEGALKGPEPWLFLLGSLLTLAGCGTAFRGFKKSRA